MFKPICFFFMSLDAKLRNPSDDYKVIRENYIYENIANGVVALQFAIYFAIIIFVVIFDQTKKCVLAF